MLWQFHCKEFSMCSLNERVKKEKKVMIFPNFWTGLPPNLLYRHMENKKIDGLETAILFSQTF